MYFGDMPQEEQYKAVEWFTKTYLSDIKYKPAEHFIPAISSYIRTAPERNDLTCWYWTSKEHIRKDFRRVYYSPVNIGEL